MSNESPPDAIPAQVAAVYHAESRRILATLIRLLGDFDLAEDAMQEAFRAALEQWPRDGVPDNPRTWLVSTGRFKAIDVLRRRANTDISLDDLTDQTGIEPSVAATENDEAIVDDQLRLIFTCCHPALPQESRLALTLREVCGLTTEEIAHAFLTIPTTLAQRIVRAKSKIRTDRIPYEVPDRQELPERLAAVLQVIYLVFNEGYAASSGDFLTRPDLSGEAIRLGRLLARLLPEPETLGLLALMLLHEARRPSRSSPSGDLVLLEDQDRSRWDRMLITEGMTLAGYGLSARPDGFYCLQAAIAAVHDAAPSFAATDWAQIIRLYDRLYQVAPSPIIEINRAVAIAMRDGPAAGLDLLDVVMQRGDLNGYHLAFSARGTLCQRLGRFADARTAYQTALDLAQQEPERRFLANKLAELPN